MDFNNFISPTSKQKITFDGKSLTSESGENFNIQNLIPRFDEIRQQVLDRGGFSLGISGGGPTLFALCDSLSIAQTLAQYLQKSYVQNELGFVHICKLNQQGATEIS